MSRPIVRIGSLPEKYLDTFEQTKEIFSNSGLADKYMRVSAWYVAHYSKKVNLTDFPGCITAEEVSVMSAALESEHPLAIAKRGLGSLAIRHSALLIVKINPLSGEGVERSDMLVSETVNSLVYPNSFMFGAGVEFTKEDHRKAKEILAVQHSAGIDLAYFDPDYSDIESPDLQPPLA